MLHCYDPVAQNKAQITKVHKGSQLIGGRAWFESRISRFQSFTALIFLINPCPPMQFLTFYDAKKFPRCKEHALSSLFSHRCRHLTVHLICLTSRPRIPSISHYLTFCLKQYNGRVAADLECGLTRVPRILTVIVMWVDPILERFFKGARVVSKLESWRTDKRISWDKLNLQEVPFIKHKYSQRPSNKKKTNFGVLPGLTSSTPCRQHVGALGMLHRFCCCHRLAQLRGPQNGTLGI